MTVFVELYGRLRDAGAESPVELVLKDGATAAEALAALKTKLGGATDGAALATETRVLLAQDRLPKEGRLAALPPVSGG
jgi:molybdopterin converting factor small subunit